MSESPPTLTRRRLLTALAWIAGLAVVVGAIALLDPGGDRGRDTAGPPAVTSSHNSSDSQDSPDSSPRDSTGSSESTDSAPAEPSTPQPIAGTPSAAVPAHVLQTLELIDAGEWPEAANAPGTRGGNTFRNVERRLPLTSASGARLTYQEWDVNPKERGRSRDAERIVTASDGSAWYTKDHYRSFIQIRGPSS